MIHIMRSAHWKDQATNLIALEFNGELKFYMGTSRPIWEDNFSTSLYNAYQYTLNGAERKIRSVPALKGARIVEWANPKQLEKFMKDNKDLIDALDDWTPNPNSTI